MKNEKTKNEKNTVQNATTNEESQATFSPNARIP